MSLPAIQDSVTERTVGVSDVIRVTPTFTVGGAGASGDYQGKSAAPEFFTRVARRDGFPAIIKSVVITDKTTTAAVAMELWLFESTFTAPTDNDAWAISDADQLKCVGVLELAANRWYANSNGKVFSDDRFCLPLKPTAQALYFALVARGATPAWATGDLQISLGVLQD